MVNGSGLIRALVVRVSGAVVLVWMLLALPALAGDAGIERQELDPARIQQDIERIRASLQLMFPEVGLFDVVTSPMPDIYEVTVPGGDQFYVHRDGIHFINGELYQARGNGFVNLTEQKLEGKRRQAIRAIPDQDKIIFRAENEKATIAVFTDVTCTYCRKIHREVPELNKRGVTVQYLAYPRGGVQSRAYKQMVSAWCAAPGKRQEALTRLKQNKKIDDNQCANNPVSEQFTLGTRLGVRGTPAIVLENGQLVPGYMPAEKLAPKAIRASGR